MQKTLLITCLCIVSVCSAAVNSKRVIVHPNLGFEKRNLSGWTTSGSAFRKQPIKGNTVKKRKHNESSNHYAKYWIGGYEHYEDNVTGTLTSTPFTVTSKHASFLVGGGDSHKTRVEIVSAKNKKVIGSYSGRNAENMRPVLLDLKKYLNKLIFIRVVDESSGGWGHINFDDFRFHKNDRAYEMYLKKLKRSNK